MSEIRIKYVVDDSELSKSIGKWQALDKESEELIKDFKAVNAEAAKAGTSIANAGSKGADGIKKTSKEAKQAKSDLTDLEKTASRVGAAIVAYFSFQAIAEIGKQIIQTTAEFEKFQAVLTNTLGSRSEAIATMALIQDFAAKTPFSVQELTASFVKLANQGFKPTREELRKLGDLASSTGKSFDQLAEAVIDAQTGEFERLKEFGIRAQKEGDKVTFTFKGVKTQVDNTNESIRNYITSLGDAAGVSGSMEAQSATLGGSISNLGDAIDQAALAIGNTFGPAIKFVISQLTDLAAATKEAFSGITEEINSRTSDFIIKRGQQLDDWQNEEINRRIKAGQKEEQIVREINEKLISLNLYNINRRSELQDKELKQRQDLAKGLGLSSQISQEALIQFLDVNAKSFEDSGGYVEKYKNTLELLNRVNFEVEDGTKRIDSTYTKVSKSLTDITEKSKKLAEENAKLLKSELDLLNKQEQLAIGRAKAAGQSEADIIRIQEDFNKRREGIYQKFGKQRELDYQFLILKEQELENAYTNFIESEEKERNSIRLALRDQIIKNIELRLTESVNTEKNFTNQLIEVERERFRNGEITLEQYYNNLEQITYEGKKAQLEAEIKADQEKLNVTKLTAEQVKAINQDIIDKQKELNDLEFKAYEEKEKKKTELTKEEIEKRKELQQQALDVFIESVNAGFDIAEGRRTAQLENLKADTEERLRLAGDNEKKKQQILEQAEQKEKAIKTRQAQADRAQAIFNIGITTALNVIKALGQPPIPGTNFVAAALAGAAGAAQLAVVLSKPIPKFAKGSKGVTGGVEGQDSVLAMLMPGEKIVPTAQSRGQLGGILDGIIDGKIKTPVDILKHAPIQIQGQRDSVSLDTIKELKGLRNDLKNLKQANISLDKNGFKSYISSQNSKTEFLNNYFNA